MGFDGREILFAWTEIAEKEGDRVSRYREWTEHNTYKIFHVNVDGTNLTQLTDGPWNEFDPCYLPNGRIVFISERRGGYGRCHGRPVPSYTLDSMNRDGSDIVCLSPHETNEWQPSVANDGMVGLHALGLRRPGVLATRHDPVDIDARRTRPRGDPRQLRHQSEPSAATSKPRGSGPCPARASSWPRPLCHHGQSYGSIVLWSTRRCRTTTRWGSGQAAYARPELFPESEIGTHGDPANLVLTAFPLSEHFFLCVYDPPIPSAAPMRGKRQRTTTASTWSIAFGNKELLLSRPGDFLSWTPIPLQARPVPPMIPGQTVVGRPLRRERSSPVGSGGDSATRAPPAWPTSTKA